MSLNKLPITVLIAARNEERNLPKCLAALQRTERVVVIDSHSADRTVEFAESAGAEVIQFDYVGGYPKKRQWAIDALDIQTEWTFLLDADEVVPSQLFDEIERAIEAETNCHGFLIRKGFHFMGRRFRFGGFTFAALLLFRTGKARFEHIIDEGANAMDMEIHERLVLDGELGMLRNPLIHEDYKGLEAYLDRHNKYSTWEATVRDQFLRTGNWGEVSIQPRLFGNAQERRRFLKKIAIRTPCEPWLWFLYHYVFRLGFLEGRPGFIASQIRSQYIANVRAKIVALRRARDSGTDAVGGI